MLYIKLLNFESKFFRCLIGSFLLFWFVVLWDVIYIRKIFKDMSDFLVLDFS